MPKERITRPGPNGAYCAVAPPKRFYGRRRFAEGAFYAHTLQKSRLRDHVRNGHFTRPCPRRKSPPISSKAFYATMFQNSILRTHSNCCARRFLSSLSIGMNSAESRPIGQFRETAQEITIIEQIICSPTKDSTSA